MAYEQRPRSKDLLTYRLSCKLGRHCPAGGPDQKALPGACCSAGLATRDSSEEFLIPQASERSAPRRSAVPTSPAGTVQAALTGRPVSAGPEQLLSLHAAFFRGRCGPCAPSAMPALRVLELPALYRKAVAWDGVAIWHCPNCSRYTMRMLWTVMPCQLGSAQGLSYTGNLNDALANASYSARQRLR